MNQTPGAAARRFERGGVRGRLHEAAAARGAIALAHGAGSNCEAPLLAAIADALAAAGITVLRLDLPFRQLRPHGPPRAGDPERDRAGLLEAASALKELAPGDVFLGGHSYGGRQASMLAAADPSAASGLLLLSYPLHPPRRPEEMRTAHFPQLRTPALFVHGSRDPFGSPEELGDALRLIPGRAELMLVEGAGHDLAAVRRGKPPLAVEEIAARFIALNLPAPPRI